MKNSVNNTKPVSSFQKKNNQSSYDDSSITKNHLRDKEKSSFVKRNELATADLLYVKVKADEDRPE